MQKVMLVPSEQVLNNESTLTSSNSFRSRCFHHVPLSAKQNVNLVFCNNENSHEALNF